MNETTAPTPQPPKRLAAALNRRNRAAAKVLRLEEQLWQARKAQDEAERALDAEHAKVGGFLRRGRDDADVVWIAEA